jgi:uncharacterized protein YhjY with autotransporter beta-barrel domain
MNSGAFKSSVGRCAFIGKFSVLVLALSLLPMPATAASGNAVFQQYLIDACGTLPPVVTDMTKYSNVCGALGGLSSPGAINSVNVGTANASSGTASRKKKDNRKLLEDQKEKADKGASADGGGWGFLITPQYGNSIRTETDLENGYQSNLSGLVAGLDYRSSDNFVFGATLGQTKDNATFLNGAGSLKTRNNTVTFYSTWLPIERVAIDGYLGYGKINFDSQRNVVFATISGTNSGSTTGKQTMAGLSTSYQSDVGRFNLSPFINLDYIKTSINGYNETGNNADADSIALHYGDRSVTSLTSSLGARVNTSYGYDWGTLQPSARLAAVHEFQNRTRQISNELVITPGTAFAVETDAPDRNYMNLGLGISAALNGGTQLFLDYDKRAQDRLLSSWAVSAGVLVGF